MFDIDIIIRQIKVRSVGFMVDVVNIKRVFCLVFVIDTAEEKEIGDFDFFQTLYRFLTEGLLNRTPQICCFGNKF